MPFRLNAPFYSTLELLYSHGVMQCSIQFIVDTPTTKFKVNDKSVTVKSFTAPAGPEGMSCT